MNKIIQIDWKKEEKEQKIDEESILRQFAKEVSKEEFGTSGLKEILNQMESLMKKENDGVAIAAPQIGIAKRIFLINETAFEKKAIWKPLIFINPKIIKSSKKCFEVEEGCLSVRPLYGTTIRHANVTVEAKDFNGNKFIFGAGGLIAHICQHEIDHLDGILFIDHAENLRAIDLKS